MIRLHDKSHNKRISFTVNYIVKHFNIYELSYQKYIE